jgi:hypothetical protein
MQITSSGWRGSDGVAAMNLLAEFVSLIAEISRQLKVIATFVEERLPANGELIPPWLNWLRRLCSGPLQSGVVAGIVKAPAFGSWDTFDGASGVYLAKRPDHLALNIGVAKSVLAGMSFQGEMVLNFSRSLRNFLENFLRLALSSSLRS